MPRELNNDDSDALVVVSKKPQGIIYFSKIFLTIYMTWQIPILFIKESGLIQNM